MTALIRLQGIGEVAAKPASELKVGDVLSWNYSYRSYEVIAVKPCGAKSIKISERNVATGVVYERRLLKTRLVAA